MANTNSNLVANQVADPVEMNPPGKAGARTKVYQDSFEVAAADFDADGDTAVLCILPVNARIVSIELANDDLDTGSTSLASVGLYEWDNDAGVVGAVKDEDAYASSVSLQAAAAMTRIENEARNISSVGQTVWEDAGDSAQPNAGVYALVATQEAASAGQAAGTLSFKVEIALS